MLSNRIACSVLIQSKLVANYNKPRGESVGLPLEKNYAKCFWKVFMRFTLKPIKIPTRLTTINIMIINPHQNLIVSCVNFQISLLAE